MSEEEQASGQKEQGDESVLAGLGIDPAVVTTDNVDKVLLGLAQFTLAQQAAVAVSEAARELGTAYAKSKADGAKAEVALELAWIALAMVTAFVFGGVTVAALYWASQTPGGSVRDATEPIALIAVVLGAGGAAVSSKSKHE